VRGPALRMARVRDDLLEGRSTGLGPRRSTIYPRFEIQGGVPASVRQPV
jgi:hypothetical protein